MIDLEISPLRTVVHRTTWLRATWRTTTSARPALEVRTISANTTTTHAKACIVALGHERWTLVGRVGGAALRTSVNIAIIIWRSGLEEGKVL